MDKDKLKETLSFLICILIIIGFVNYTGILNNFNVNDLKSSLENLSFNSNKNNQAVNSGNTKRVPKHKNYQPNKIPQAVIKGAYSSNTWTNIFNSDKKVIFYTYNNNGNDQFNNSIQSFINNDKNYRYYNVFSYSEREFNAVRANDWGTSKICDSLEECNQVRLKASNYSVLAEFFKRCSRTMCIIHPQKQQFFMLKQKDPDKVRIILEDFKSW